VAEEAKPQAPSKTILVVEPNEKLQIKLRNQLKKFGYRVRVMSDPQLALSWFETQDKVANCVVFSAGKLGDAALNAFNRFGELPATKRISTVLLLDPSQEELQQRALLDDHRVAVSLPIRLKEFQQMLEKLLTRDSSE
jgi:serine/threonine-protein kinase